MSRASARPAGESLDPEKLAYWYFRLNGFFQIENFVVHPEQRGGQRTDADLLAVRFPFRAERLFDDPNDIMVDDVQRLALSDDLIDVVIAEVKTNQPCTLNGPWTLQDRQNVHRVLAAIEAFRLTASKRRRRTSIGRASTAAAGFASALWRWGATETTTLRQHIPK
jgi:hypothetical protein